MATLTSLLADLAEGRVEVVDLTAPLSELPPTGAVLIAAPLPIVGGSASPARVLALVTR